MGRDRHATSRLGTEIYPEMPELCLPKIRGRQLSCLPYMLPKNQLRYQLVAPSTSLEKFKVIFTLRIFTPQERNRKKCTEKDSTRVC